MTGNFSIDEQVIYQATFDHEIKQFSFNVTSDKIFN